MLVFLVALIFGVCQVLLTEQLLKAFNVRCGKGILLFFFAKFMLYAVAIGFLVLEFVWYIGMALAGFSAGVPIAAIAIYFYRCIGKKK